jgi:hypothetical protein
MRILLTIVLLIGTAYGQSTTIGIGNKKLEVYAYSANGALIGSLVYDSASRKTTISGNQSLVYNGLRNSMVKTSKQLDLSLNVLRWIDSTGAIRYPVEFMSDLKKWYNQNK